MIATRIVITALVLTCATAAAAQTHAELLEKAIFTDETAGDLPGAIRIYERLLSTPGISRDIAARAQTRLAEGRRRRDQAVVSLTALSGTRTTNPAIPTASAPPTAVFAPRAGAPRVEFQASAQQLPGCCGMFSANYDPGRPVTVRGKIIQAVWTNPETVRRDRGIRWEPMGVHDRGAERAGPQRLQQRRLQAR